MMPIDLRCGVDKKLISSPALVARAQREKRTAYIHVNNRFEGNAIETIDSIL